MRRSGLLEILLKESRAVHSHLTGNLAKRRVLQGPRAKAKEGLWIQNPAFPLTSTPGASTSLTPPTRCHPPLPSPAEPICLSDSLDEDLTAPTLDSVSHALALLSTASKGLVVSPPPLQLPTSSYLPFTSAHATAASQHSLAKMESAVLVSGPSSTANNPSSSSSTSSSSSSPSPSSSSALGRLQVGGASLPSKPSEGLYGLMKGPSGTPAHSRPSMMMGGVNKLHPQPSPPPKQRPPPTASPLLPPHQKGFSSPTGALGGPQGPAKSSAKTPNTTVVSSSNGGSMGGGMPPPSRNNLLPLPRPTLQSYCPPVSSSSSSSHTPSPSLSSHIAPAKPHPQPQQHHQSNFITPMQATLTKSSHSSNSSSIIKLTPRPPAPTPAAPPPSSSTSSSSSSLSQPQVLSAQQHQFSQKAQGFRPPYSIPAGVQAKLGQASYSFAGGQKTQAVSLSSSSITTASPSNKINNNNNNNNNNIVAMTAGSIRPGNSPSPSSSSPSSSVSANHGQRQRSGGGASQGSKAGNGRVASGTPSPSHLAQVSSVAGAGLVGSPPALPLGFGMLGGLVPVSLPFQFPSLLNFSSPPGVPGSLSTAANSGFSLAQNELLGKY
ncbi:Ubinuclein-2 [Merluccius polli]|uniref:Ubinuclein-2 n=1 Tax=Merluccius polli TaxID=89951 RepID=A0AA47NAB0_MERPO|nr:Ubinuclein-2 [Merluccius polli]